MSTLLRGLCSDIHARAQTAQARTEVLRIYFRRPPMARRRESYGPHHIITVCRTAPGGGPGTGDCAGAGRSECQLPMRARLRAAPRGALGRGRPESRRPPALTGVRVRERERVSVCLYSIDTQTRTRMCQSLARTRRVSIRETTRESDMSVDHDQGGHTPVTCDCGWCHCPTPVSCHLLSGRRPSIRNPALSGLALALRPFLRFAGHESARIVTTCRRSDGVRRS